MIYVLDASAVLAVLFREAGADRVEPVMRDALMNAVNASEVIVKLMRRGVPHEAAATTAATLGILSVPFDGDLARSTAWLEPLTRPAGLSLADRSCIALARSLAAPALTADRAWGRIADAVGVRVQLIR